MFDCLRRWKVSRELATFKLVRRLVNSDDSSLIVKACIGNTIFRNFKYLYSDQGIRFLLRRILNSSLRRFLPIRNETWQDLISRFQSYTLWGLIRIVSRNG